MEETLQNSNEPAMSEMPQEPRRRSKAFWVVLLVIIVVIALAWWQGDLFSFDKEELSDRGGYQAVFLTNNQVYFGKLSDEDEEYPVLREIYYLRVTTQLQPLAENVPSQPAINLVKLGNELHGPQDEMRINKEHILFVEDLKPDSQVVTAIENFKAANQ